MTTTTFDPDKWTTSFFRALFNYTKAKLNITDVPATDLYELVESYPDIDALTKKMPIPVTIIHFDIEDMDNVFFGLGDNVVRETYLPASLEVEEWEAHCHVVNIDVGVWASIESGGPPARLEARQDLDRVFNGPAARDDCMAVTDGVEILSFTGGRHITDAINDVPVFRVVDQQLRVRVYSRTKKVGPAVEVILQNPQLTIQNQAVIG